MSGLESLSQTDIENLSDFRSQINMQRASNGQQSIAMDDALKFLKASHFNATKAVEIYKNYQKHRDVYDLDNMNPHRDPLSAEIASKKLDLLSTHDLEGSPVLVFTGHLHGLRGSIKASMQLLFYTLDQLSMREKDALDEGVVVILDMRDCAMPTYDVRFVNNIISVMGDGYPVIMKILYIVSAPLWFKTAVVGFKHRKLHDRLKHVSVSDLTTYFSSDQLPVSLGGSFLPGRVDSKGFTRSPSAHGTRSTPTHSARNGLGSKQSVTRLHSEPNSSRDHVSGGIDNLVEIFGGRNKLTPLGNGPHPSSEGGASNKPLPPPPSQHAKQGRHDLKASSTKPLLPPPVHSEPSPKSALPFGSHRLRPTPPQNKSAQQQDSSDVFKRPGIPVPKVLNGSSPVASSRGARGHPKIGSSGASNLPPPPAPFATSSSSSSSSSSFSSSKPPSPVVRSGKLASRIQNFEQGSSDSGPPGGSKSTKPLPEIRQTAVENPSCTKPSVLGKRFQKMKSESGSGSGEKPSTVASDEVSMRKMKFALPAGPKSTPKPPENKAPSPTGKNKPLPPTPTPRKSVSPPPPPPPYKSKSFDEMDAYETVEYPDDGQLQGAAGKSVRPAESSYENVVMQPEPRRWSASKTKKGKHEPAEETQDSGAKKPSGDMSYENIVVQPEPKKWSAGKMSKTRVGDQSAKQSGAAAALDSGYKNTPAKAVQFSPGHKPPSSRPPPPPPPSSSSSSSAPKHAVKYENISLKGSPLVYGDDSSEEEALLSEEEGISLAPEEVIYENFGPDEGNCAMTPKELEKHFMSKGKKGLSAEYLKIKNEPLASSYRNFKLPCNKSKNRYKDVVCYDDTRVPLQPVPGVEGSDFIHANYVSGYNRPEAFILTQGPLKKTVVDFWRLLWEKNIFVVVMTTKCVELGKLKCAQYWPDEGSVTYGNVTVTVATTEHCQGFDLRTLKAQSKGVERTIMHFQFLAWPDYGVPDSGTTILPLIKSVREMQKQHSRYNHPSSALPLPPHGPPIVVHCSAGVGRSGTFCTVDYCIDELNDQGRVNVQGAVRRLRHERAFAIQTDEQYAFCYSTMVHYAKSMKSK